MKKTLLALAAAFGLVSSLPAEAQFGDCGCGCPENWYVEGFAGVNWANRTKEKRHHKYQTGYDLGILLGYRWESGLRLEGELSYRRNQNKHHSSDNDEDNRWNHRHHEVTALLANALYEFDVDCFPFKPYLGGGIGWGNTRHSHQQHHNNKNNSFVWQLIAGLDYPLCDNLDLDLRYNFFVEQKSRIQNNSLSLGVKYYF